jgi:hypothetical protein
VYIIKLTTDPSIAPDVQIIWQKLVKDIPKYSLYKKRNYNMKIKELTKDCTDTRCHMSYFVGKF